MNHPIVLAHGIARFDVLRESVRKSMAESGFQLDDSWHYFRNIKSHLDSSGFDTHHASVSFAGQVDVRANELAKQIDLILQNTQAPKVHIIGHSMGGLDARHMIVDIPGMAEKVASLTTIGTPHLGTMWADIALEFGGQLLVDKAHDYLDLSGFRDLTTDACTEFNRRAEALEAANRVEYRTWSSCAGFSSVFWVLQASWLYLQGREGDNDGLVSVKSQAWTNRLIGAGAEKQIFQHIFPCEADHLNQIGWWDPSKWVYQKELTKQISEFEDRIKAVYLEIARGLPEGITKTG